MSSMRQEVAPAGTLVCGMHFGCVDTGTVRHVQTPKARPQDIAAAVLGGAAIEQSGGQCCTDAR